MTQDNSSQGMGFLQQYFSFLLYKNYKKLEWQWVPVLLIQYSHFQSGTRWPGWYFFLFCTSHVLCVYIFHKLLLEVLQIKLKPVNQKLWIKFVFVFRFFNCNSVSEHSVPLEDCSKIMKSMQRFVLCTSRPEDCMQMFARVPR